MREEPVFSGGVVKAVLVLIFAGALGFGAYALVSGGIDLPDLPDLPEAEEGGGEGVVELTETSLSETTIDPPDPVDTFTTAAFADALAKISAEAGPNAEFTRLLINETQTQAVVLTGDTAEALSVRADSGELVREEATITITGEATIDDFAFPISAVKASALDRMLAAARARSGAKDLQPTVLSLERGLPFGRRQLEWTINARGGGRNLLFRADADGTRVRSEGPGSEIPPEAIDAQRLNDCIQDAAGEPDEVFACLERFE